MTYHATLLAVKLTFKDENPRPAGLSSNAVHLRNSRSEEATKTSGESGC
jgi:hypothetical protein